MNRSRIIKIVVLIASLTMFYLQMKVSIENLTDPPIVTTEQRLSFEDIEPPLITICPQDQIDETKLKSLGYANYDDLLRGRANFGADKHLTFFEVYDQALTFSPEKDIVLSISNKKMSSFKKTFHASLGYCWEISDYKLTRNLKIKNNVYVSQCNISEFKVYLTDKSMVSKPTIDLSTHVGNDINFEKGMDKSYLVEITRFSSYNPEDKDYCKSYAESEFKSCVDDYVVSSFSKNFQNYLACHPPFLTDLNECSNMKWFEARNLTFGEKIRLSLLFDTKLNEIQRLESFSDKHICTPSCTVTRSNVKKGKSRNLQYEYCVSLKFEEIIIYSKAAFGYNFSNFLVDLGSAVGLWFGISVFGKLLFY